MKTDCFNRENVRSFFDDLDSIQKLKVLPDSEIDYFRERSQYLLEFRLQEERGE